MRAVMSGRRPSRWRATLTARIRAGWWFALAAVLVGLDYLTGPYVQVTATFILPVFLCAWYSGVRPALVLAIGIPFCHAGLLLGVWGPPWDPSASLTTAALRAGVYGFNAVLIARLATHERQLREEIEVLEGILPICMHCKSIRTDEGEWQSLERYISHRSAAQFSHGLCPTCRDHYYPTVERRAGPPA